MKLNGNDTTIVQSDKVALILSTPAPAKVEKFSLVKKHKSTAIPTKNMMQLISGIRVPILLLNALQFTLPKRP